MRKNGSRLISFRQYRLTDSLIFAGILLGFDLIVHYSQIALHGEFTFSPMPVIVAIVMMRWGWQGVIYAVADGLLYCGLNYGAAGIAPQSFAIYGIGNLAIALVLLAFLWPGKQKIAEKWYFSALFVVFAWITSSLGRCAVAACFSVNFVQSLLGIAFDFFTPAVAIVIVLIVRRLDGVFEDQKHYLLRLEKERLEKARVDEFGEKPIDIDEESLTILRRHDEDLDG